MHKTLGSFGSEELDKAGLWPDLISGITGMKAWYRVGSDDATQSGGRISALRNRVGEGGTLAQASAALQPAFTPANFGPYPAMTFDGVDDTITQTLSSLSLNLEQPLSLVLIGSLYELTGVEQTLLGIFNSSSSSFRIVCNTGSSFRGIHAATSLVGPTASVDEPFMLILSTDRTTARFSVNGTEVANGSGSGALAGGNIRIGSANTTIGFSKMHMAEAMVVQADLSQDATALRVLNKYVKAVYGIDTPA